jgi:DNA-3-methyladenine glycosylase II
MLRPVAAAFDPELLERARRTLARRDPVLRALIRRVGPCGLRRRGDPYRALLRSVLYQQLAGAAARAIHARLRARFGGRDPRPGALLAIRDAELRAVGLSRQKIAALRSIAEHFDDGRVDGRALARMDDDAVIACVTQMRGVGLWTAHMLLMFSLGRPDVLPVGDYGIRKGVQALYGLPELPERAELERVASRWRPWRSVASWYVWRYADPGEQD